jgi:hypothetical protein
MAVLQDGDFELDGYLFSGCKDTPAYVRSFSQGKVDHRIQDAVNPVGDNMFFGRDYLTPASWEFGLRIRQEGIGQAASIFGGLVKAWRADSKRLTPGAMSVLRYNRGGVTRRVYGRARGIVPNMENGWIAGIIDADTVFDQADQWHYDDAARSLVVTLIPGTPGGLLSPLISPLTTIAGGTRQGIIEEVGGEGPAPYTVKFSGPVTDPSVIVSGREVKLLTTLAYDQVATIDTRLMTATRSDGANLSGALSRKTRLTESRIKPGPAEVIYSGTDATGTSTCTVTWRPTYYGF